LDIGLGIGLSDNASASLTRCNINITDTATMLSGAFFVQEGSGATNLNLVHTAVFGRLWLSSRRPLSLTQRRLSGEYWVDEDLEGNSGGSGPLMEEEAAAAEEEEAVRMQQLMQRMLGDLEKELRDISAQTS